jgi:hypothetical protein
LKGAVVQQACAGLNLNPMWMLLFQFDLDAWKFLKMYNAKHEKSFYTDPALALWIILIFLHLKPSYKEALMDLEWI